MGEVVDGGVKGRGSILGGGIGSFFCLSWGAYVSKGRFIFAKAIVCV